MPHYLIEASYTPEGVAGVAAKGGTARRDAIAGMVSEAGGNLESFYFAFGGSDVYAICEMPNDEAAAAIALSINQSSTTSTRTAVLLTPEQIDEAAKLGPNYTPPGG
jgi:uncharacterized protein with GYD domain